MISLKLKLVRDQVTPSLRFWLRGIQDWSPAFKKAIPKLEQLTWERINKNSFPPLRPKYKKEKDRKYPGRPILVRTGKLLQSLTDKGAPGAVRSIQKRRMAIGSSVTVNGHNLFYLHRTGAGRLPVRNPHQDADGKGKRIVYMELIKHARAVAERNERVVGGRPLKAVFEKR